MCFYDGMRHVFSHCCKQTKSLTELEVQVTLVLQYVLQYVLPGIQEHWKTLKKSVYLVYTSTCMELLDTPGSYMFKVQGMVHTYILLLYILLKHTFSYFITYTCTRKFTLLVVPVIHFHTYTYVHVCMYVF